MKYRGKKVTATLCLAALAACSAPKIDYHGDGAPRFEQPVAGASRKTRLALVLGGGGPRGIAHIGVLKVLEANRIVPDLIVGTSSGSIVGAAYAAGLPAREIERLAFSLSPIDVFDFSYSKRGYIVGAKLQDYINRMVGNRPIERLEKQFAAVTTDAKSGRLTIFNRGDTGLAVRASSSILGQFHPVKINGREYLDGDLVSPVPIKAAKMLGAEIVIAVDVSAYLEDLPEKSQNRLDWIGPGIMRKAIVDLESPLADVVIHPNLDYYAGWGDAYKRKCIARAEAATLQALPAIQALLQQSSHKDARQ